MLADRPGALLLDVRSPGEWNDDVGHIEGARLIPIADLPQRLEEIASWKDQPVIVVCRVGARSGQAADLLVQRGFVEVYNLEGGMVAWRRAGF
jgi:rhodanese-related sulfurtransferase